MPGQLNQLACDLTGLLTALALLCGAVTAVGVIGLCAVGLSWVVLRASMASQALWTPDAPGD